MPRTTTSWTSTAWSSPAPRWASRIEKWFSHLKIVVAERQQAETQNEAA
jgi:hypothetical protein